MSNLEKASRLLQDFAFENGIDVDMYHAAKDLLVADLLMPDMQIIRTVEELEALDPDTLVGTHREIASTTFGAGHILATTYLDDLMFPMVVVSTGDQVRAAREAMEEDNE